MLQRIAVALAGGRDEERRALFLGQPQRIVRAQRTHLERLDRNLQIIDRRRRRRKMKNEINLARQDK